MAKTSYDFHHFPDLISGPYSCIPLVRRRDHHRMRFLSLPIFAVSLAAGLSHGLRARQSKKTPIAL